MPYPLDIDPEIDEILARCSTSIKAHCQVFHSSRFHANFSRNHEEFFEMIDDPNGPTRIVLIAHRHFGKTSISNYGIPSQAIAFSKARFVVPVSATAMLAMLQSENLKNAINRNDMLKSVIGEIESPDNPFSKELWKTKSGVKVLPRGAEQQVRGIIIDDDRPDLVIVDDLEKTEEVQSAEQRAKIKNWFFSDLTEGVAQMGKRSKIIVIGTILHQDSLLEDLRADSAWTFRDYRLCEMKGDKFISFWPEFKSDEECKKLYEDFKRRGKVDIFYREYLNEAAPAEDATFKQAMFKYYNESELDLNRTAENIVIIDPARTTKMHSAYSAIVCIACDWSKHSIYIRDVINERLHPDELYKKAFEMASRHNAKVIGYEVTGLSEFITQPITSEMMRLGYLFELVELKPRRVKLEDSTGSDSEKDGRIASLATYYRTGLVYHNPTCCAVLEQQLMAGKASKYKDVADAVSYMIEMFQLGERYFDSFQSNEDMLGGTPEDEFSKLALDDLPIIDSMSVLNYV